MRQGRDSQSSLKPIPPFLTRQLVRIAIVRALDVFALIFIGDS